MLKMLHLLVLTLLTATGVLSDSNWDVNYSEPICAAKESNVIISCSYSYPETVKEVKTVLWCSMNSTKSAKNETCDNGPYIYDSSFTKPTDRFEYMGDKKSNCTLLINNVQFSDTREYKFRFITDSEGGKWTGHTGVLLEVGVLKISMIKSGSESLKEGDSVNLTCAVNCTSSQQFVWFKNNKALPPESVSVLHFPNLTVNDSGEYSCALKNKESFKSEIIKLQLKAVIPWSILNTVLIVLGVVLVILLLIVLAVICKRRRKVKAPEEASTGNGRKTQAGESTCGDQTKHQTNSDTQASEALQQEGDAMYASVRIKPNNPKKERKVKTPEEAGPGDDKQTQEEELTYASVSIQPKPKEKSVRTVHLEDEDSTIYSEVVKK